MVDGFHKSFSNLIEARLVDIFNSEEFTVMNENIFTEFEQKLTAIVGELDTKTRTELLEAFSTTVFNQTHHLNKLSYRVAFSDAMAFFMDTMLNQK